MDDCRFFWWLARREQRMTWRKVLSNPAEVSVRSLRAASQTRFALRDRQTPSLRPWARRAQHREDLVNQTPSMRRYLRQVAAQPKLSREREYELATHFKRTGCRSAADQLVASQLRHVIGVARRFANYGVPFDDLVAQGNLGVLHALSRYDAERGFRFGTYAMHWIRAMVIGYVLRSRSIVITSSDAMRTRIFFRLKRERARLEAQLGEGPEARAALAQTLGLRPERLERMLMRIDSPDVSLQAPGPQDQLAIARCSPRSTPIRSRSCCATSIASVCAEPSPPRSRASASASSASCGTA